MNRKKISEFLYGRRVRAGTLAVIAVIVLALPSWKSLGFGLGIGCLGLLFRAWAAGHLRKEKELTVSGPYQYTRNPLYFGSFIIGIGVAVASRSWWVSGSLFAYFLVFYPMVIRREKERMNRLFPEQYKSYGKLVPLFVPGLRKQSALKNGGFRWELYKINKEYRALIGLGCLWGILALKMLFFR